MHRLLKVIVQVVLVEDDGETLTEKPAQPVEVNAADWPGYPAKLATDIAALDVEPERDSPNDWPEPSPNG